MRTNSNTLPCKSFTPDLVTTSVYPAAPCPISAGSTPELDLISRIASTLKFENVAPPISGSVVSMASIENTVALPRCPLTVNCCVKFAAPFVSVCVPADSSSSWLKSRLLSGRADTCLSDKSSPPAACVCGFAASMRGLRESAATASRSIVIDRNRFIRKGAMRKLKRALA